MYTVYFLALQVIWSHLQPGLAQKRILGGEEVEISRLPYMAGVIIYPNINNTKQFSACAGCILTKDHVLTVAHCVPKKLELPKAVIVCVGSANYSSIEGGQHLKALKIYQHDSYEKKAFGFDIALIRVQSMRFSKCVQPITLVNAGTKIPQGTVLTSSGWGRSVMTKDKGLRRTSNPELPNLRWVNITTMSDFCCARKVCNSSEKNRPWGVICFGDKELKSFYIGDSGGPVVLFTNTQPVLVGLAMGGVKEQYENTMEAPIFATSVSTFRKWIDRNLKQTIDEDHDSEE